MPEIPELKRGILNNACEAIGNTPLIKLNNLNNSDAEVIVKMESFNPTGSIKDRVGVYLIEDAENKNLLNNDSVIIEPTSGNTGIALGFAAASKGYKLILTMPENMSKERQKLLAIFGAELVLTPADEGMEGAIAKAEELEREIPNGIILHQFDNPANSKIHEMTTAREILRDCEGEVDVVVAAVGTGGTLNGIAKVLKEYDSNIKIVAVEPFTCQTLGKGEKGPHKIQGIGAGFIPSILDVDLIDEVIPVKDEDAGRTLVNLAKKEGIFAGISSGASTWAALQLAGREENKGKRIIAILPDNGERYLSEEWIFDMI